MEVVGEAATVAEALATIGPGRTRRGHHRCPVA
jgi:hypothetical protein